MSLSERPRRSALYVPASNTKAVAKARDLPVDVVILDLEDAVSPEEKEHAREAALAAIREGGFGRREVAIRANGLDTPWGADDIAAIIRSPADALLVPKISGPNDIVRYDDLLGSAPASMQLWAMVETCACLPQLDAIASVADNTRLSLFVVGTNDLAKEMRATLTNDRLPFLPFLSMAVAAARAHGLAILDGVCNEFRDLSVFQAEVEQGKLFGFDGKTLIHPSQVGPCNEIFSPSAAELTWAQAVIEAFSLPENAGKGALNIDGKMAELLHLEQARRLVAIDWEISQRREQVGSTGTACG